MTMAVATVGLLIFALGVFGLVRPAGLITFVERPWRTRAGLYLAVCLRLALGVLLIAAAASTRYPWMIGALGVLSVAAALLIPVLGYDRIHAFIDWWVDRSPAFIRAWAVAACAFGAFLTYAAA